MATFSFGKNWRAFLGKASPAMLADALSDTKDWIPQDLTGKRVLDIGSGSGIHSFAFHNRGAGHITSFDVDPDSVEATRIMHQRAGCPTTWRVEHASILDADLVTRLASTPFDIVYSWGVLHHTGQMWTALENACRLVAPEGKLWISLYAKGHRYPRDLALKRRYNSVGPFRRRLMEREFALRLMYWRIRAGQNPFTWKENFSRGMDPWCDIRDWLGGLPYEVASVEELVAFMLRQGFHLTRLQTAVEGACHIFLLQRHGDPHVDGAQL